MMEAEKPKVLTVSDIVQYIQQWLIENQKGVIKRFQEQCKHFWHGHDRWLDKKIAVQNPYGLAHRPGGIPLGLMWVRLQVGVYVQIPVTFASDVPSSDPLNDLALPFLSENKELIDFMCEDDQLIRTEAYQMLQACYVLLTIIHDQKMKDDPRAMLIGTDIWGENVIYVKETWQEIEQNKDFDEIQGALTLAFAKVQKDLQNKRLLGEAKADQGRDTISEDESENIFKKDCRGYGWLVKFGKGEAFNIEDSVGIKYIHVILEMEFYHKYRLAAEIKAKAIAGPTEDEEKNPRKSYLKPEALEKIDSRTQREILKIIESLEEKKNDGTITDEEEESLLKLKEYMSDSTYRGRRTLFKTDEIHNAADAVRKGITKVLGQIKNNNEDMYEHFKNSIKKDGVEYSYKPKDRNIVWDI
ncbi:MAG: hypothetical protein GY774_10010 [Planctomycetes bacterium]|nr:hypothetical protein [Planctomycetota bacterium]